MHNRLKPRPATLGALLLLLLGAGLILYPHVSNWYYAWQFQRTIGAYDQFADVDCDALWAAAQEYNQALAERGSQFSVSEEERAQVAQLLNPLGNGMMGYVDIPKIDVHLPIYQGTEETELQAGAGWWLGTSLPTGGGGHPLRPGRPQRPGQGQNVYRPGSAGNGRHLLPDHFGPGADLSGGPDPGGGA